jgi:CHAD domain-containing protein
MSKKPRQEGSFGRHLADRARAICTDAARVAADAKLPEGEAIHEIRRQLKRWRALLRLMTGAVGKPAERMSGEARALMKALATARDAQSALDALRDLAKSEVPVPKRALKAMATCMRQIRGDAERHAFTPAARKQLRDYFARAASALDGWPFATMRLADAADSLTDTYRRARKLVPGDWRHAGARELHALRRRVVEFRHQIDLLADLWPSSADAWGGEAQRLRGRLGACQDLAVLDAMMDADGPLARWRADVRPAVAARRQAHLKAAARIADRLFDDKPKRFHRRILTLSASGAPNARVPKRRPSDRKSR